MFDSRPRGRQEDESPRHPLLRPNRASAPVGCRRSRRSRWRDRPASRRSACCSLRSTPRPITERDATAAASAAGPLSLYIMAPAICPPSPTPAPAVKQQPFAAAESSKDLLVPGVRQAWAWSRRLGKEVLAAVGADRLMRLGAKPAWAQKARGASAWPPSVCSLPPAPPVAASISPGAVGPPFCHPREHRRMVALQFGEG